MQIDIQHLTIHFDAPPSMLAEAALSALSPLTPAAAISMPGIGQRWPSGGIYAGVARGEDGASDAHLVLLDDLPAAKLDWAAAVAWAQGLGGDAHLPSRTESALLYAHTRDSIETGEWYWTATPASEGYAWRQTFDGGGQYRHSKSFKARARAVRRFPL